ncbi:Protein of unknown function [Geopseudomonas sagittaria]|uniref:DUF3313 domain-containing protein n=1 Tax=Geopseudomonas sagittaria TaxID=1135990 RepID=A0A1I5TQA7_9GAMM|nr:DUF3313 domain-containing protein [Pseudomonas sagittaria]SFP85240.1 Protein of unknown function [Pseudomonas sagittaria]
MKRSRIAVTGLLFSALLLGGCASQVTKPEQYSGFLKDYSRLQPATSATGQPVMRWMAPGVKLDNYRHVMVQSIGFYPAPTPSEQIGAPALADLQTYTSEQIKAAFGRRFQVHEPSTTPKGSLPGPQTLVLRAAITGVDTKAEGLKPYEVIPIALVTAAATTAAGARDRTTELFVEAELIDASTGQPVLQVVRKGYGKELENKEEQVTLNTLKVVIDGIVRDIEKFE